MKKMIPFYVFFSLVQSCISSHEDRIELHDSVYEDIDYGTAYEKYSTSFEMIDNFETKFVMEVTVLSPGFRQAFAQRFQELYNEPQPVLTESSDKGAFFISMFAAKDDMTDLSDDTLWNIQLFQKEQIQKPIKVKKISNKARWRPFFKGISPWSKEFIVLFDVSINQINGDFLKSPDSKLVFSNPNGKMTVSF